MADRPSISYIAANAARYMPRKHCARKKKRSTFSTGVLPLKLPSCHPKRPSPAHAKTKPDESASCFSVSGYSDSACAAKATATAATSNKNDIRFARQMALTLRSSSAKRHRLCCSRCSGDLKVRSVSAATSRSTNRHFAASLPQQASTVSRKSIAMREFPALFNGSILRVRSA